MEDYIYKKIELNNGSLELKGSLYRAKTESSKGVLLYYHGGGLLYGNRNDLPNLHIDMLTKAGYSIFAFDYRLAPEANFDLILRDVLDSIEFFIMSRDELGIGDCPYFLWGRSAGAYLALIASTSNFKTGPRAIISYYGYGFTIPDWYNTSNIHYLKYPLVKRQEIESIIKDRFIANGDILERYSLYVYARQSGKWISMITGGSEDKFLSKYSLLNIPKNFNFPPSFIAHSFKDNDVPFRESMELCKIINESDLYTCSIAEHDFDRYEKDKNTLELLNQTISFLDSYSS